MLQIVRGQGPTGTVQMEKIFSVLSGVVTPEKKALCNAAMVDWQTNVRKKKVAAGACPYYSPSSSNTNIRVFFATTKTMYDWRLTLDDLSGFPGSLTGVIKVLYEKRANDWVSMCVWLLLCPGSRTHLFFLNSLTSAKNL